MIRKRIGKTIEFHWRITTDGEDLAFDGRDLTIVLIDPSGSSREMHFEYEEGTNIAKFAFQGKDQTRVGFYSLEVWENKGRCNQTVADKQNAFELVRYTKDEGNCGCKKY